MARVLGLQKMLEDRATVQMVVSPYQWRIPDGFPTGTRPDVVILDLETEHDATGTINQIRKSAPTSKIVLLCGFEDQSRTREAFAAGVDGIILTVQPPTVMLAVLEALYATAQLKAYGERDRAVGLDLAPRRQDKERRGRATTGVAQRLDGAGTGDYPVGRAGPLKQRHRL